MNRLQIRDSSMIPDSSRTGYDSVKDLIFLVEEYIEKHRLLPAELVVAGVSGGADSMALLFVLKDIRDRKYPDMTILAAHMNHGIREEASRDEEVVKTFCDTLSIPFCPKHVDIPKIAEEEGISLETAGRIERYKFFRALSGEDGIIAVAHHMEDQAESIAMHIFRGSGMEGLTGIRPKNGNVIHPFLGLHKNDIVEFCRSRGIPFCNDVTNADISYDRNFWRNEIFPMIEKGTDRSPVMALTGLSERISEENDYLDELAASQIGDALEVSCEKLMALPRVLRRRVLKILAVRAFGDIVNFESVHWEALLKLAESTVGTAYVSLPDRRKAARENGKIRYITAESAFAEEKGGIFVDIGAIVPEEAKYEEIALSELPLGEMVNFSQSFVQMRLRSVEKEGHLVYNNLTWFFPSSVLEDTVIRTRRTGDTILRAGNTCHKELRRFMNEAHIPPRFRDRMLLAAKGQEILWLPGWAHSVGFTDAESEGKYRAMKSEDTGAEKLFALEFFGEQA